MPDMNYPYIRAWEDWIGNPHLTLNKSLELAASTNAPATAVFYNNGTWTTFEEITNLVTLRNMKIILNNKYGFNFNKKELKY